MKNIARLVVLLCLVGTARVEATPSPTPTPGSLLASAIAITEQVGFTDHWKNAEECLAATSSPLYYPSILNKRPLGKDEVVRGHPTGGCFEMALPDRLGKRGFVRIETGRKFVYNSVTGELLRLAECNNNVYSFVPFAPLKGLTGPAGPQGNEGPRGDTGAQGLRGEKGDKGDKGDPGQNVVIVKKGGFPWKKAAIWTGVGVGVIGTGYATYYYWPCIRNLGK